MNAPWNRSGRLLADVPDEDILTGVVRLDTGQVEEGDEWKRGANDGPRLLETHHVQIFIFHVAAPRPALTHDRGGKRTGGRSPLQEI